MRFVTRADRISASAAITAALLILAFLAYAWHPALHPVEPPAAGAFEPSLVRRGAELAALGECRTCHTSDEGPSFAGGRGIPTPFGTIYSTNITPDAATGIGRWSLTAFTRAMRAGIDRQGQHLYPAFPYDHFTLLTDDDIRALYAFLMTRQPVREEAPANAIPFPLGFRPLLAAWKLLYFRERRYREDERHGAVWNRGAYLAEGLGHCGACHTPRNALGAEKMDQHFGGAESEGWHAYAINRSSQAPVPWDAGAMEFYLRNGWQQSHGVARGPMAPVTESLAQVSEADVRAIASYVVSGMARKPGAARSPQANAKGTQDRGADIYTAACADCHDGDRPLPFGGIDLSLSIGIAGEDPTNLLHVVRDGLPASGAAPQPIMPGFGKTLSDQQLLSLVTYLRRRFADKPAWPDIQTRIQRASR